MRQMIRKIMFAIAPFLLCMGICIPAYAMTPEEKELFDALGVEYSLDENGDFEAFHPDVNMERMTYEQKLALAEKYKGVNKVGNYSVTIRVGDNPNDFFFDIGNAKNESVYEEDNCCSSSVIFFDADGDFLILPTRMAVVQNRLIIRKEILKYWRTERERGFGKRNCLRCRGKCNTEGT